MKDKLDSIMKLLDTIEYGFPNEANENIIKIDYNYYDNNFYEFYYLQTPEELLKSRIGVCWDQVELERELFSKLNIKFDTYWISIYDHENVPSHTFLTFEYNNKYYWFEHSWNEYRGIHEYDDIKSLLIDVRSKFKKSKESIVNKNAFTCVFKYNKPKYHISCEEYYKFIETQEYIKLDEPLYFYHLVNKTADIKKGLLSLEYTYNHKMYDLFDKNVEKYKERITGPWNIEKYKGKSELTREEYLDALRIFRGGFGAGYIYFFKYPPYKELGSNMTKILNVKDIYRIDINDFEVIKNIEDIFYGYENSNSDNKMLDKSYYENITKEEYFARYDDNSSMSYAALNHIGISFRDGYCPYELLERVEDNG